MIRTSTKQIPFGIILVTCACTLIAIVSPAFGQERSTEWLTQLGTHGVRALAYPNASTAYVISDSFSTSTLNPRLWSFVDPLGDGALATNGNQVLISVPEGVAHDAWTGANNAPRILQSVTDGDFEIIAKIDSPMSKQYQTSGIMVQESPATYLRFDINSDGDILRAFAASVSNNIATAQSGFDVIVDSNVVVPLYIAVKRTGTNWQMAWSKDGSTWALAANFNISIIVNAVGLFAANQGSTPPAFTASFDFLYTGNPSRPTLASPADGATNQLVPTPLSWNAFAGATTYRLQVATDPAFAGGISVNDSTIIDTTRSVAGLARDTWYYWRTAARNAAGAISAWSVARSFKTAPAAPITPTLLLPADAALDQPTSLQLRWTRSASAATYHLQVGTDSLFASALLVNDSTLVDTSKSLSGLQNSTRYFWRVRALGVGGGSAFSGTWRFTTVVAPPATPVQLSPLPGATNQPSTIVFAWTRVPSAALYHLQIAPDSLFISGLVVNDSTISDTTKGVGGLALSSRYFWRVRAKNAGGGSAFSGARELATIVGAPSLLSPANGAGAQPLTVTLRWGRVQRAIAYRLQMGTDSTFASGLIKNDSTITDTSRVISGLVINQRYYWRVNARDASGSGPFSPTWSFLTYTPLPDPITLFSPANSTVLSGDTVRCVWSSTQPLVERYALEYAADSLFIFKIVDSTLTDTVKVVRGLIGNTRYFWRVRAKNPGGWGAYTAYWTFRSGVSGVEEGPRPLPAEFSLAQNYPNPFNPTTRIEFALPREARVLLEVYNLLGQRVGVLVDGVREAGYHVATVDAGTWPSGVYLYRLAVEAGGPTFVRRMVVVK